MRALSGAAMTMVCSLMPAAVAAQAPTAEPIVQVGVFGYRADGAGASAAYDTEPSLDSRVFTSGTLCQVGAGYRQAPAWAIHGWRFSGRLLTKTAEEAVVELTWQRLLDSGHDARSPENAVRLTLRAGERVTLDSAAASAASPCSLHAFFEARYTPRLSSPAAGSHARGVDGTGVGGSTVRAAAAGLLAEETRRGGSRMHVDLWLVHTLPDGKEETIHERVQAADEGTDFGFAPITLVTSRGPVVVQIGGSFGIAQGQLTFVTTRTVKYRFHSAHGGESETQGTGRTVTAMPTADEVLAFELPPIPSPGSADLPNQLAVRLRIGR